MQDLHDLSLLLDRQVPLLLLESHEEARALEMLTRLAIRRGLALQQWTLSDGLRRLGFGEDIGASETTQPADALRIVREREQGGLFIFCDLHPFLEEPLVVRLLKDIALQHERYGKTVALLSHRLQAPPELQRLAASFSLQLPDDSQLLALVKEEAQRYAKLSGRKVRSDNDTLQQLVANLKGLTFSDARRLVRGAIVDDGAITQDDVPAVSRAKMALLDMDGVMSFEYDTARFSDVAGLEVMKTWLAQRQHLVAADGEHLAQVGVDARGFGEKRDQRYLAAAGLTELHRLLDGELVIGVDHILEARVVGHPGAHFESRLCVGYHLHQHGDVHGAARSQAAVLVITLLAALP